MNSDASGIEIKVGDTVRTPDEEIGLVVHVETGACSVNIPLNRRSGGSRIEYNIPCGRCLQLYSGQKKTEGESNGLN